MTQGRRALFASLTALLAASGAVAACGSRTELYVPEKAPLPPIAVVSPPDAPDLCADAGATLVYLITSQDVLLSFYPPTATFTTLGTIACPAAPRDSPFSMAVDHRGIAYVAFASGDIFRVDTATAACSPTGRTASPGTFQSSFGMGFAANVGVDAGNADADDTVETLYLAGNPDDGITTTPIVLGSMDTTTFAVTTIGTVTPSIYGSELTGTGGGQLFGFYLTTSGGSSAAIGELDRVTGQVVAMTALPGVDIAGGWAFGVWGGDFYLFTEPHGLGSIVQRFRPSDGTVTQVATTPGLTVVGAGVSTCAPQR